MITENAGTLDTVILRDIPLTVHLSLWFTYRGKVVTLKPVSRVLTTRAVLFLRGKFHYTLLIGRLIVGLKESSVNILVTSIDSLMSFSRFHGNVPR